MVSVLAGKTDLNWLRYIPNDPEMCGMILALPSGANVSTVTHLASMIHADADLGWRGRADCLWVLFPSSGDIDGPAGGPSGPGFHGPRVLFP